jgi:periplasmic protein TonB
MVAVRCGAIAIGIHLVIAGLVARSEGRRVVFGVLPNPLDVDLASPEVPPPTTPETTPAVPAPDLPAPPVRAIPIVHQTTTPNAPSIASSDATHPNGGLTSSDGQDDERKDPPTIIGTASTPPPQPPTPRPPPPPPPPPPPAVDRSGVAKLRRTTNWDCPWPPEADADQIDEAYVVLTVYVDANGRATNVAVNDPGHGFGREARKCAMREMYTPGTDRDGHPIPTITKPFRVHFAR